MKKRAFALALLLAAILLCAFTESDDFFRYELREDGAAVIVGYTGYDSRVTIPKEVDGHPIREIGTSACYGNRNLRKLIIEAELDRIDKDAFGYCPNLKSVTIESCPEIGESAFEGCALLTELVLPENLSNIDDFAFKSCLRLGTVDIPASLARIGYESFLGCDRMVLITGDCPIAAEYAAANGIDTDFGESNASMWLKIGVLTVALLFLLLFAWFILRKFRRKQEK